MANSVSPSAALDALRSLGGSPPALPSVAPHLTLEQMPHLTLAGAEPEKPAEPQAQSDEPAVAAAASTAEPIGEEVAYADEEFEDEEEDAARAASQKPKSKHKR